ncbi:MAG: patatin-like phospholipase family protein [Potamolinea sp.]
MTFKILILDGGGIRGVLSAKLLMEVKKILKEKTGKELHQYFDLIAGTSTG